MISENIINAIINQASKENKDKVLSMFILNVSNNSYNDDKVNHVLEMLINNNAIIKLEQIDSDYIIKNFDSYIYNWEKYIIKDIKVIEVDNIESIVRVSYKYKEKVNEDREDIEYYTNTVNISFVDNKNILK